MLLVGFGLAVVIAISGPTPEPIPQQGNAPTVLTMTATKVSVRMTVTAHGEILPKTESNLVAEVAGRVELVSPSLVSGGFFERGDVLVAIERIDYEVALGQALAKLASVRSDLANAEREHTRLRELAERESVSKSILDDARNRLSIARASLDEASLRVARAERDLERTSLVAPFDGRVRTERVDAGQFVNRGESIATLYSIDFAEARLPVNDADIAFLPITLGRQKDSDPPKPKAILKAHFAGAERTWHARIVRTEGELDPRTRMVNLIAQVEAPYDQVEDMPPLTVGLFVKAEIEGNDIHEVVPLPRSALRLGNLVYIVNYDDRLVFREVKVVRAVGEIVYIGDGIEDGEIICLSPLDSPIEGQLVKPTGDFPASS